MAFKVKWAQVALKDLKNVAGYISKDSEYYAAAFVREVLDAAGSLARMPLRGRIVPEFGSSTVHELIVKTYRLIYTVVGRTVIIIAFIHGARDIASTWVKERGRPVDGEE